MKGLLCFLGVALAATGADDLQRLLPAEGQLSGWRLVEAPRTFRGDALYDLIDGAADLYLEYGFKQTVACRYAAASSATLEIEIYEMNDATAAYGVYSLLQPGDGALVDIGQAARLSGYYLVLWKGPYYVNLTVSGPSADARTVLASAARQIAAQIKETGAIPPLVERLPKDGLLRQACFRGRIGLSNLYAFGADNPFEAQEGVCGFYRGSRLFVFRYATAAEAAARLTAASRSLAESGSFQQLSGNTAGFDCLDSASNRITARLDGDCITVRVQQKTGAGDR